jgi:NADH:ubiquinone oxidoreductase subunit B-like Fe-S oxidoreductase
VTFRQGDHEMTVNVFDAGLACCAVEVGAALRRLREVAGGGGPGGDLEPGGDAGPEGDVGPGGPAGGRGPGQAVREGSGVHVLVVAGTVTDKLAPFVLRAFQETPEPRRVLSFGACSNSGGPYWDSYCVTKGADQLIPVDLYIPGCPPRPEALLDGLRVLGESMGADGPDRAGGGGA